MYRAVLFLAAVSILVLCVESRSMPRCGKCNTDKCMSVDDCECGTYLDRCGCCSYCLKCPGEQCSKVARERCTDGYECMQEEGLRGPARFNTPGTCVAIEEDEDEDEDED